MKPNRTAILLVLTVVVSLAACAVGPDFKEPETETPITYRRPSVIDAADINLKWWELFDDPFLHTLVSEALERNRDIKIAIARIEEARAALGFTDADLYPKLDIEAGATRGNLAGRTRLPTTDNNFFIGPVLNWEIDFWGKYRRASETARAELTASDYALKTVQFSLISEVVSTYFRLLDYHQRLTISERTLASRVDSLVIITDRFQEGILPEIDVNQAQIQKEIAASAIPLYRRNIAVTENALSILVGTLPGEIKTGIALDKQRTPPEIPTGLPSSLLERRPDIQQSKYLLEAQNARVGVAQALRFPAISLTGVVGLASNDLSTLTDEAAWSVGGSLVGPLFHFNQNRERVEIEKARTRQTQYRYEQTVLTAFREVEDALVEIETYREQLAAVTRKQKAAQNANALSKERYDKGVASYLEVLESERTLFSVELELSETTQAYLSAYVKLYKALGGGWLSVGESATEAPAKETENMDENQESNLR